MAVQGPYTTESEEYYQERPRDYVYGQVANLIRKYTLDSGYSLDTYNNLFKENQSEIRKASDVIFESIKSNAKQALGKEPTGADIVDIANDITQWGTPVKQEKFRGPRFDIEHLKGSVLVNIPQILINKENQINTIRELESEYSKLGEQIPEDLRRRIFRKPLPPEELAVFLGKQKQDIRERLVQRELAQVPQREEAAISELEKALTTQQKQFFEEQAAPSIISQLNVRGLLDTGSLATALAAEAGRGQQRISGITTPLRAESRLGGVRQGFEQTLRGALESGRSLEDAINFSRQLYAGRQGQEFAAEQARLGRGFQQDIFSQQRALELALQPRGPSALDYYLQYGLGPSLGIVGSLLGGRFGKSLSAGAGAASATQYGGSRNV